jgi:hypothetical protein
MIFSENRHPLFGIMQDKDGAETACPGARPEESGGDRADNSRNRRNDSWNEKARLHGARF